MRSQNRGTGKLGRAPAEIPQKSAGVEESQTDRRGSLARFSTAFRMAKSGGVSLAAIFQAAECLFDRRNRVRPSFLAN